LQLFDAALARGQADALITLFGELRKRATRREEEERLAVVAAGTIAKIGNTKAANALADALALDPHESIRVASAEALGTLCDRSTETTLQRALKDGSRNVQKAARLSLQRCKFTHPQ
jgi:HEAT repeat protein